MYCSMISVYGKVEWIHLIFPFDIITESSVCVGFSEYRNFPLLSKRVGMYSIQCIQGFCQYWYRKRERYKKRKELKYFFHPIFGIPRQCVICAGAAVLCSIVHKKAICHAKASYCKKGGNWKLAYTGMSECQYNLRRILMRGINMPNKIWRHSATADRDLWELLGMRQPVSIEILKRDRARLRRNIYSRRVFHLFWESHLHLDWFNLDLQFMLLTWGKYCPASSGLLMQNYIAIGKLSCI